MKLQIKVWAGLAWVLSLLSAPAAQQTFTAAATQDWDLKWQPGDVTRMLGSYIPQRLALSTNRPAGIKKIPSDLEAPFYAQLKIGPREQPATCAVLLDEPANRPARLFFDGNGNGDLTDDLRIFWEKRTVSGSAGAPVQAYLGSGPVKLPFRSGPVEVRLGFYRFAKGSSANPAVADALFYYRDYALSGQVKLGGKAYTAMLIDELAAGDFRGRAGLNFSGVRLLLDLNGDGHYDLRRESLDVQKPFNIGGTTWEFADMTADGRFQFVRSSKAAPEIVFPVALERGAKAIPFQSTNLVGQAIKFPADYRGKLVLLDFWATWCGPCRAEIPNLVENYAKYHARGFEILGINLDREESIAELPKFTQDNRMTWPQIPDERYQHELALRYNAETIPFMLLVDGDSGEVLAGAQEIRGPFMSAAIEAALARKKTAR